MMKLEVNVKMLKKNDRALLKNLVTTVCYQSLHCASQLIRWMFEQLQDFVDAATSTKCCYATAHNSLQASQL